MHKGLKLNLFTHAQLITAVARKCKNRRQFAAGTVAILLSLSLSIPLIQNAWDD